MVEFFVYNANLNYFGSIKNVMEFTSGKTNLKKGILNNKKNLKVVDYIQVGNIEFLN